jgi:hypothetical protein
MIEYDPNGNFLKEGTYNFVITNAVERTSKNNDPMIAIEIEIKNNDQTYMLRDFVVVVPKMLWRLKQLCKSIGIDFMKGKISDSELLGKKGDVEVVLQETEDYGPQNRISRYIEKITLDDSDDKDDSENTDDDLPF